METTFNFIKSLFSNSGESTNDLPGIKGQYLSPSERMYAKTVRKLASQKSEEIFFNHGTTYAAIIMGNIFYEMKNAPLNERFINIFAKDLNGEISSNPIYFENLEDYINAPSTQLNVIYERDPEFPQDNCAYNILRGHSKNNVTMKKITAPGMVRFRSAFVKMKFHYDSHFTSTGLLMSRVESDNSNHIAKCCFKDKKNGESLNNVFTDVFNNYSTKVSFRGNLKV